MRRSSQITPELKAEIIKFAQQTSTFKAQQKYEVWSETIKYWLDPLYQTKIKTKSQQRYKELTPEQKIAVRLKHREYLEKDLPRHKEKHKAWISRNREKISAAVKQHRLDNLQHYKQESRRRYLQDKQDGKHRIKYHTDSLYKLKCNMREALRRALKFGNISKSMPSLDYLGCTIDELKTHLERQFKPGMTWDNHGRGEYCWHIDHIKPLDLLQTPDVSLLQKLCHYTNLQPLWEKENLSKNNKTQ